MLTIARHTLKSTIFKQKDINTKRFLMNNKSAKILKQAHNTHLAN